MDRVYLPVLGSSHTVPVVSVDEMKTIDRVFEEHYGVGVAQQTENDGRELACLARDFLASDETSDRTSVSGARIVVLVGNGGNGAGGLIAARRLAGWGATVNVVFTVPEAKLKGDPRLHLTATAACSGVSIDWPGDGPDGAVPPQFEPNPDLILDAIFGYSLKGAPRPVAAALIRAANNDPAPILSLECPSGFDLASGTVLEPCIEATMSMALALPKTGLERPDARGVVGRLWVADVGVPASFYAEEAELGFPCDPFFSVGCRVELELPTDGP